MSRHIKESTRGGERMPHGKKIATFKGRKRGRRERGGKKGREGGGGMEREGEKGRESDWGGGRDTIAEKNSEIGVRGQKQN